ncbi:hypothetical protein GCM10010387_16340 [Streptomyces inusitatus]|uniref:Uncharacterized protein n=1 Tax=Streptomyces inusitatus TaxID=68221 RepID=A0A918PVT5_9ACTN|nr:hypothetical protein [Streptomyces inusitatus]GGZ23833.1 hypothetical protein GCM10010387_16340 [Streptomyces inusitatus]
MPSHEVVVPLAGLLDWSHPRHYDDEARPCWHCGAATNLRDGKKLPSCKVCAEADRAEITRIVAVYGGAVLPC